MATENDLRIPRPMTAEEMEKRNRKSWYEPAPVFSGVRMRQPTGGTLMLCRDLGITFLDNFDSMAGLAEGEVQRQVFTFLFVHGHPSIPEMIEATALPEDEFRKLWLIPFAMPMEMAEIMPKLLMWITDLNLSTLAAIVDVVPKPSLPGAKPPPAPPPNSSSPPGCQESLAPSRAKVPSRKS